MLTLPEFKTRYFNELLGLTEEEIKKHYQIYLEDPFEFRPEMIN